MKKETDFQVAYVYGLQRLSKLCSISHSEKAKLGDDLVDDIQSFLPQDDLFSPVGKAFSGFCFGKDYNAILEKELKEVYDINGYVNIEEVNQHG